MGQAGSKSYRVGPGLAIKFWPMQTSRLVTKHSWLLEELRGEKLMNTCICHGRQTWIVI